MADFLEKATSGLTEAKDSVTTTAESFGASLTDAHKTVASSAETVKIEAEASAETAKTEAAATKETVSTQAKDAVDKAMSRGIEGAKALLNTFEENRTEVSSKLVGAVTNVVDGTSSSTVASRDLPISTDNQPLLESGTERGVETTPWWKNCCGVLDLLKTSTTSSSQRRVGSGGKGAVATASATRVRFPLGGDSFNLGWSDIKCVDLPPQD